MILDTNGLSAWAEEDGALIPVLASVEQLMLPVIVIGEYRYGLRQSRDRVRLEAWLDSVRAVVRVLPITVGTADSYASVRLQLRLSGRPIPANDMWIAALAIQYGVPIISRDRQFDAVDGVTRIDW